MRLSAPNHGVLSSVPFTADITVNHDNVLAAGKILTDVLADQGAALVRELEYLSIVPPGGDPVSVRAADEWNAKVATDPDSYRNQVVQYLGRLRDLAEKLQATAKSYGYSDERIAESFTQTGQSGGAGG